jgi:glucose/arabinose dehydrogenase
VPLLSPEDEAKTFNLPQGFHAEVVAAEPMVEHPVQVQFDPDGRLWVVEMRGYMPNIDGVGEDKPVGRISVLEDTDGDGRMDKSTVFMDKLVMPRAIGLVRDGALVAVPPKVLEAIIGQIPAGRLGSGEEIAATVSFLAGERAAYVTGTTLSLNGGQYLVG